MTDCGTFCRVVWAHYQARGRQDLPWRRPEPDGGFDPYKILVSELMLQQTQVARALTKYPEFLAQFPDVQTLASAPLGDVLVAWQGLGYNRRAKYLWQSARLIVSDFGGRVPQSSRELTGLPGVGLGTAGAIQAFAFNLPAVFIETNIRSVFIYHFFPNQTNISDKQILDLVKQTLPDAEGKRAAGDGEFISPPRAMRKTAGLSHVREWYWALMDYGAYLKQAFGNNVQASQSYQRQSPLKGSRREIRGRVLRLLAERPRTGRALRRAIADERLAAVLRELAAEGLIWQGRSGYSLFRERAV